MPSENRIILDTSAILAFRLDEAGADIVEELLRKAEKSGQPLLASFMTRMELLYIIRKHEGEFAARQALGMIGAFNIDWIPCEPEILDKAAILKSRGGLSIADSWVAATALIYRATLIHKDPEFCKIPELSQQFLESSVP
ncbi:MAG: PIN domain-containing protein [Acidobacteriota bacterium]|nr:PIN domain-containing protein [Acidobacteriota bacterium]